MYRYQGFLHVLHYFGLLVFISVLNGCSYFELARQPLPVEVKPEPITQVESHEFPLQANDSVVGQLASVPVQEGDTFSDIARHYGLGYQHLTEANPGTEPWTPPADYRALLPLQFILPDAPRKGVVINVGAMRLFYYSNDKVITYPVGTGKEGRATPLGQMKVERKTAHPVWYVPESIRNDHAKKGDPLPASVPPGPDNPLGDFAFYLSEPSYLIHGTNKPYSIGFRASNGCIRLYPENIQLLFDQVPEKTPVKIVNQPYLLGTLNGEPYLEAHDPYEEVNDKQAKKAMLTKLKQWEKKQKQRLDWPKIEETLQQARGIPIPILENTPVVHQIVASAIDLEHPRRLYAQPDTEVMIKQSLWYIRVLDTVSEVSARRTAAFLNHQGPRIPALALSKNGRFQVIAGPYKDAKAAKTAQKRMKIDLELAGEIIPPGKEKLAME